MGSELMDEKAPNLWVNFLQIDDKMAPNLLTEWLRINILEISTNIEIDGRYDFGSILVP